VNRVALALLLAALSGCAVPRPVSAPSTAATEAALLRHIEVLASDEFEGRRPGTEGEAKTLRYLSREWQAAGLESGTNDPANPWFAPVDLALGIPQESRIEWRRGRTRPTLPPGSVELFSFGRRGLIADAPVIFVGGEGERLDRAELAGRVALLLWDHEGQAEQREALFAKGASAVIAILEDSGEYSDLVEERRSGIYRLAGEEDGGLLEGLMTAEAASELLGPTRFSELALAARAAEFQPVPLDLNVTLEATSTPGTVRTHNLIARLPGRRREAGAVLLMAHWDHFGRCAEPPAEDLICNGAVDNASGLAVLTELARRLAAEPQLDRDVYFVATTAEEWGLLGAHAFAQAPPIPLGSIVAAFNLDTVAVAPRGSPVAIVGGSLTAIGPMVEKIVRASGRALGDPQVSAPFVRRQDGWALLRRDVPAVAVTSAFAQPEPLAAYLAEDYHQPSDEAAEIELGGAADDLVLHLALIRHFADPSRWPGGGGQSTPAP
jgi:aminopeptidase YwaD